MYWDNRINNRVERPTAPIYALRKGGQIDEAYQIALRLYNQDPDDDIKKALSWVLIDLCKKYISEQNLNQAQIYFNQLSNIQFDFEDDFVDTIQKQTKFLKPKIDLHYGQIQQADELSKNGQEQKALDLILIMIANKQLTALHHETYGWIIYRYVKAEENNLTSIQVRTFLRDYMNLQNERPSMLHSMMLNFALNYSKTHSDFNFYNFFVLWNPENLRDEDLQDGYKDGHDVPSLISRICRELSNSNSITDLETDIITKVKLDKETILDFFREPYFWNLFTAHKENKFADLWQMFAKYNEIYSKYGKSKWHSEILKITDRFMKENESWRFLIFFKEWNPNNLMDADWKEEKGKDGETYKPLAVKAIKKAFEVIKNQQNRNIDDLGWLIEIHETAIKLFPNDEWLIREKALLHLWQNDLDSAIAIYKKLVLELGDKFYIWSEFAECVNNGTNLKIGMLSKALCLERNEDFLGDIHLKLAKLLINENLLKNALLELETYKQHREEKSWKLSQEYDSLCYSANTVNHTIKDNSFLYDKYIPLAENFAYKDIAWTEAVLINRWKTEEKKERLSFTDGNDIEFSVGVGRFPIIKKAKIGEVYKFKFNKQEIKKEIDTPFGLLSKKIITEYKYIPLLVESSNKEAWAILPQKLGFIEYINQEKKTLHIITNDSEQIFYQFDKEQFAKGQFLTFKQYKKKVNDETRNFSVDVKICDKEVALPHFKNRIVVIDDVNESKRLFHYVLGRKLLTGIAFFDDTNIHPKVGDFIKAYYCIKKDKNGKKKLITLFVERAEEENVELIKTISGRLEIKDGGFAFVNDCYVSKKTLEDFDITDNCYVSAKAVYIGDGDKWKVFNITKT